MRVRDVYTEDRCWECHEFIEVEADNNAYCLKCLALCGAGEP